MFKKLGIDKWVLYANCDRIDCLEVRYAGVQHALWETVMCFSSGHEKVIFTGGRDECESFADTLLGDMLGMRWQPKEAE